MSSKKYTIVVLPGDGIGPEITKAALPVLDVAAKSFGFSCEFQTELVGGAALEVTGSPLPEQTLKSFEDADAVLLGAVGAPKWDEKVADGSLPSHLRPEAGLLQMRRHLGLFSNLRPVVSSPVLSSFSPLKPHIVQNVDLVVVRELTGGIYFGLPAEIVEGEDSEAVNTMRYRRSEIERIARVAFEQARGRRRHVTSVDKANVLAVSRLWRKTVTDLRNAEYPDITLEHMYVDNAAMQLVSRPADFDVILTANLFGDILSDLSAVLVGSLGLLPSASLGGNMGLFEPVHGSAPDIAGRATANPTAIILSVALLLDYLGERDAAAAIRMGVEKTFEAGFRTADVWTADSTLVSTTQFAQAVADNISTSNSVRSATDSATSDSAAPDFTMS